jgi:hypothetical protein
MDDTQLHCDFRGDDQDGKRFRDWRARWSVGSREARASVALSNLGQGVNSDSSEGQSKPVKKFGNW